MEGTFKDHQVPLLALHRTTPRITSFSWKSEFMPACLEEKSEQRALSALREINNNCPEIKNFLIKI